MSSFFVNPPSAPMPSAAPFRQRTNDLSGPYRYRRDNSQDEFVLPRPRRRSSEDGAPVVPVAHDMRPPPGIVNRFYIWLGTTLFGRSGH